MLALHCIISEFHKYVGLRWNWVFFFPRMYICKYVWTAWNLVILQDACSVCSYPFPMETLRNEALKLLRMYHSYFVQISCVYSAITSLVLFCM
jgi:hypothetical protein